MKRILENIILTGSALLLAAGCTEDFYRPDVTENHGFLQIEGEIAGKGAAEVKAVIHPVLGLSYQSFVPGDRIGFFSFHEEGCDRGETQQSHSKDDDKDYFKNEPFVYSDVLSSKKFVAENIRDDVKLSDLGMTFAYFPYSSYGEGGELQKGPEGYRKKDAGGQYVALGPNDYYLDIFNDDGNFEDLLIASKRQYYNVNYDFNHHFAILLVYLGTGFDASDNETLTVRLTEKVIGAHVTRGWTGGKESFAVTIDRVPLSEDGNYQFGKSELTASRRDNYQRPGDTDGPKTVYPLVLPPGTEIDYIEVTDITGEVQKVKPTKEALPGLVGGMIYPMTVGMSGLEPVIWPHEIIGWNEQPEIEVTRLPGIYNADDLQRWVSLYNENVGNLDNVSDDVFGELEEFGEWDDEERHWTFYLRDSVDCTGIVPEGGTLIRELPEGVTFDGGYNTLHGLMFDFEHKTPADGRIGLVGEIKGGTLQNMRLKFVTVRNLDKDITTGCIAAVMSSGRVFDSTVRQASMICDGVTQAGVLSGRISGGSVEACKFHGMIQADVREYPPYSDYKGIVGIVERTGPGLHLYDVANLLIFTDGKPSENQ